MPTLSADTVGAFAVIVTVIIALTVIGLSLVRLAEFTVEFIRRI